MSSDATLIDYGRRIDLVALHFSHLADFADDELVRSSRAIGRIAKRMASIEASELGGVFAQVGALDAIYPNEVLLADCDGATDLAIAQQILKTLQRMRRAA